jgi:hypothetical protein
MVSAESVESAAADTTAASALHVVCFLLSVLAAAAHSLWPAALAIVFQRPHAELRSAIATIDNVRPSILP